VYAELRTLAATRLRFERAGHTLQPTDLAHEAWLRLAEIDPELWQDRPRFMATAARLLRQILVDHARRRRCLKRGRGAAPLAIEEKVLPAPSPGPAPLLDLEEALSQLSELNARAGRVAELRVFGGLTCAETAEALNVSPRTVEGDWATGKAWLRRRLLERAS
jgi:RNA polymerase sigma factor (TIGR02999 family)